jgi:hypothetical protein
MHIGYNHDGSNPCPSTTTAANFASEGPRMQPLCGLAVRAEDPRPTDTTGLEDGPSSDPHRELDELPPTDERRPVVEGKNGGAAA